MPKLAPQNSAGLTVGLSLFPKQADVLPQAVLKSRSREIDIYTFIFALKFDGHIGSSAADMPVKFQSDINTQSRDFTRSWGKTSVRLGNRDPGVGLLCLHCEDR